MLEDSLPGVARELFIVTLIFILLFIVYISSLYLWIIRPMGAMRKSMEIIRSGNLTYRIPTLKNNSMELDEVICEFNSLMNRIEHMKIRMYENRLAQNETELEYLSLQKIRYPRAFDYSIICAEALSVIPIPPFIIESFVGNAVKYGIRADEPSQISIKVTEISRFHIHIEISDMGNGFSEDSLDAIREFLDTDVISEELGVGIRNSVNRLRLIYKDKCTINVYNRVPHGAVVEIDLLLQEDENGNAGISG